MAETNDPCLWRDRLPWPDAASHKHSRGRLGVVSGGPLNTGAARLAARAGLRVGAGLVKVLCPPAAAPIVAGALEAVMVEAFTSPESLEALAEAMDAVVIGPAAGLNEATVQNRLREYHKNRDAVLSEFDRFLRLSTVNGEPAVGNVTNAIRAALSQ